MRRPALVLTLNLALAVFYLCHGQDVKGGRKDSATRSALTDLVRKAAFSGSLEFSGQCGPQQPPILPHVRTRSEAPNTPLLVKLRNMFADNLQMRVTQEADGTIRVLESGVSRDILEVKISRISFNDAYDVRSAETLIVSQPEVQAFMKANDINSHINRFQYGLGLRQQPQPGLPHISETLENVTVHQALDRLLKTFHGVWVYENCPDEKGGRVVAFDYLQSVFDP
jgi:hypothetical protein